MCAMFNVRSLEVHSDTAYILGLLAGMALVSFVFGDLFVTGAALGSGSRRSQTANTKAGSRYIQVFDPTIVALGNPTVNSRDKHHILSKRCLRGFQKNSSKGHQANDVKDLIETNPIGGFDEEAHMKPACNDEPRVALGTLLKLHGFGNNKSHTVSPKLIDGSIKHSEFNGEILLVTLAAYIDRSVDAKKIAFYHNCWMHVCQWNSSEANGGASTDVKSRQGSIMSKGLHCLPKLSHTSKQNLPFA